MSSACCQYPKWSGVAISTTTFPSEELKWVVVEFPNRDAPDVVVNGAASQVLPTSSRHPAQVTSSIYIYIVLYCGPPKVF